MPAPKQKTSKHALKQAILCEEVVDLRIAGLTMREIGRKVGRSPAAVYEIIRKAIVAMKTDDVDLLRETELQRTEQQYSHAAVIFKKTKSDTTKLGAIDRMTRVTERRSKMLGLDAADKFSAAAGVLLEGSIEKIVEFYRANEAVRPRSTWPAAVREKADELEARERAALAALPALPELPGGDSVTQTQSTKSEKISS